MIRNRLQRRLDRLRQRPDEGASLVYALTIIAVISIIIAALLAFADSAVRTAEAMAGATETRVAADGAAEIAVNTVRQRTYTGGSGGCFGGSSTLNLSNFYQPAEGPATSATVTCQTDTAHTVSDSLEYSPDNVPANALLTLGTDPTYGGTSIDPGGRTLQVDGAVYSASQLKLATTTGSALAVNGSATAEGPCTGDITADPLTCDSEHQAAGDDPHVVGVADAYSYPVPPTPLPSRDADIPYPGLGDCTGTWVTLNPGLYTDTSRMDRLSDCANLTVHFTPGVYYFALNEDGFGWYVRNNLTLVAGELTTAAAAAKASSTPLASVPGACKSPVKPASGTWEAPDPDDYPATDPDEDDGVTFVFAGTTRLLIGSARVEICGRHSATSPPFAIYGLKESVDGLSAQTGCVAAEPPDFTCAAIKVTHGDVFDLTGPEANGQLYVEGTVYLPQSWVDVRLSNTGGPLVSAGLIARSLTLSIDDSAVLDNPIFALPDFAPPGRLTVLYLNVYLCRGASTCSATTGVHQLKAKIGVIDPTGTALAGHRQIAVYSWSSQISS